MDFKSKSHSRKSYEPQTKWPKREPPENSHLVSKRELNDLETLPVMEEVKTPKRKVCQKSNFSNDSPQFRVGWDDGFDSNKSAGVESPVIHPVQQKIRRCPDELYRGIKQTVQPKILEFERDRELGCVTWAKNLLEISMEPLNESPLEKTETSSKRSLVDTIEDSPTVEQPKAPSDPIRIPDDDFADELMVLCSQAIEDDMIGKHSQSYEYCQPKKPKLAESPKSSKNESRLDPRIEEKKVSRVIQFDQKNVIANESDMRIVKKSDTLVNSMDLFKCFLDDDDEFSSIDFNSLDNLENTNTQGSSIPKPNFNECNQKPKYTKEQIEQRRLEAKKKLLFKKNKSM